MSYRKTDLALGLLVESANLNLAMANSIIASLIGFKPALQYGAAIQDMLLAAMLIAERVESEAEYVSEVTILGEGLESEALRKVAYALTQVWVWLD